MLLASTRLRWWPITRLTWCTTHWKNSPIDPSSSLPAMNVNNRLCRPSTAVRPKPRPSWRTTAYVKSVRSIPSINSSGAPTRRTWISCSISGIPVPSSTCWTIFNDRSCCSGNQISPTMTFGTLCKMHLMPPSWQCPALRPTGWTTSLSAEDSTTKHLSQPYLWKMTPTSSSPFAICAWWWHKISISGPVSWMANWRRFWTATTTRSSSNFRTARQPLPTLSRPSVKTGAVESTTRWTQHTAWPSVRPKVLTSGSFCCGLTALLCPAVWDMSLCLASGRVRIA